MSRFDNPTFRLMAPPIWPVLSNYDQHHCLRLSRDRRVLSVAAAAVDRVLQDTLARYGERDEPDTRLYLGGPIEANSLYYRSRITGWRCYPGFDAFAVTGPEIEQLELTPFVDNILVLHDFDRSGFSICGTLGTNSRRYRFKHKPPIRDIGLRLTDVVEMGLQSEPVPEVTYTEWRQRADTLRRHGATPEEIDFLRESRVEINAMTSRQIIDFIEKKFAEYGVKKLVPDDKTLEQHARPVIKDRLTRKILDTRSPTTFSGILTPPNFPQTSGSKSNASSKNIPSCLGMPPSRSSSIRWTSRKSQRVAFKTDRLGEFVGRRELTAQIGHPPDEWPLVLLKEALDNSLDGCEDVRAAPDIAIDVSTSSGTVTITARRRALSG